MAKSKYAPALFEVIHSGQDAKDGGKLPVPKWWKRGTDATVAKAPESGVGATSTAASGGPPAVTESQSAPVAETAAPPETMVSPETVDTPVVETAARTMATPAPRVTATPTAPRSTGLFNFGQSSVRSAEPVEEDVAPPVVQMDSGRVILSLNPVNAALVAGALLIVVFSSYLLGQRYGGSPQQTAQTKPPDEVEKALNSPPDPKSLTPHPTEKRTRTPRRETTPANVTNPVTPKPATPDKPVTPVVPPASNETVSGGRAAGAHYVVLETFKETDRQAAEFARDWLAANRDIKTTVEVRGGRVILASVDTFDYAKPGEEAKARQYIESIKKIGKVVGNEMSKAGHPKYVFAQPGVRVDK